MFLTLSGTSTPVIMVYSRYFIPLVPFVIYLLVRMLPDIVEFIDTNKSAPALKGVMALFSIFLLNGITVAMRARDRAAILLVVGLLSLIGFHVVYNTAMVVGLLPITGIPVPFLSYGGSFVLANFIATGLILGVDYRRYVNR